MQPHLQTTIKNGIQAARSAYMNTGTVFLVIFGVYIILYVIFSAVHEAALSGTLLSVDSIPLYEFYVTAMSTLLFLLVAALIQSLVTSFFVIPGKPFFWHTQHSVAQTFWRFVGFSIFFSFVFFVLNLMLGSGALLILSEQTLLGILVTLLWLFLLILFSGYYFMTPFLLVEKKYPLRRALRESRQHAHTHIGTIISLLLFLGICFTLLQTGAELLAVIPFIGFILYLISQLFIIVLVFGYVFALYRQIVK